jgi:hypothetical protein
MGLAVVTVVRPGLQNLPGLPCDFLEGVGASPGGGRLQPKPHQRLVADPEAQIQIAAASGRGCGFFIAAAARLKPAAPYLDR